MRVSYIALAITLGFSTDVLAQGLQINPYPLDTKAPRIASEPPQQLDGKEFNSFVDSLEKDIQEEIRKQNQEQSGEVSDAPPVSIVPNEALQEPAEVQQESRLPGRHRFIKPSEYEGGQDVVAVPKAEQTRAPVVVAQEPSEPKVVPDVMAEEDILIEEAAVEKPVELQEPEETAQGNIEDVVVEQPVSEEVEAVVAEKPETDVEEDSVEVGDVSATPAPVTAVSESKPASPAPAPVSVPTKVVAVPEPTQTALQEPEPEAQEKDAVAEIVEPLYSAEDFREMARLQLEYEDKPPAPPAPEMLEEPEAEPLPEEATHSIVYLPGAQDSGPVPAAAPAPQAVAEAAPVFEPSSEALAEPSEGASVDDVPFEELMAEEYSYVSRAPTVDVAREQMPMVEASVPPAAPVEPVQAEATFEPVEPPPVEQVQAEATFEPVEPPPIEQVQVLPPPTRGQDPQPAPAQDSASLAEPPFAAPSSYETAAYEQPEPAPVAAPIPAPRREKPKKSGFFSALMGGDDEDAKVEEEKKDPMVKVLSKGSSHDLVDDLPAPNFAAANPNIRASLGVPVGADVAAAAPVPSANAPKTPVAPTYMPEDVAVEQPVPDPMERQRAFESAGYEYEAQYMEAQEVSSERQAEPVVYDVTASEPEQFDVASVDPNMGAADEDVPVYMPGEAERAAAAPDLGALENGEPQAFDVNMTEQDRWRAQKGHTLKSVLQRWAAIKNIEFSWESEQDFDVIYTIEPTGSFENAVRMLLDQYLEDDVRPIGHLQIDSVSGRQRLTVFTGTG